MIYDILLFILAGGLPYYIILEKMNSFGNKKIFSLSAIFLLFAILFSLNTSHEPNTLLVIISLLSAIFSIYKATKTTNFYKLAYYLIFINSPLFILLAGKSSGEMFSLSLLISLIGLFLIGRFYEKNYGSANYSYITGITLTRPYIGTYLTIYLIAIALYPPFPNSFFLFNSIINSEPNLLLLIVGGTIFFGNFYLAMGVVKRSLFGKPNKNIHYVNMTTKEKIPHTIITILLLILSIWGFKELLL